MLSSNGGLHNAGLAILRRDFWHADSDLKPGFHYSKRSHLKPSEDSVLREGYSIFIIYILPLTVSLG